ISLTEGARVMSISGKGAGVVESFVDAMRQVTNKPILLIEYSEHALSNSASAQAIAYIQLSVDGQRFGGSATSSDIVDASFKAILSAINRSQPQVQSEVA
ncbi:MAG: alpha-isopropylmalate synthase regulatory domain-containing protein, partial [Sinobacterium sp.]